MEEKNPHTEVRGSAGTSSEPVVSHGKRGWRGRGKALLGELLFVALIFAGIQFWQTRNLLPGGERMPQLRLQNQAGDNVLLWTQGKPTVLFLFAPWCSVCKLSAHNLVALRERRPASELSIVAVGLAWKSPQSVWQYGKEHEFNFPVLLGDSAAQHAFRIDAFPTIYVLDKEGNIRYRSVGYTTELGLLLRTL